MGIAVLMQRLKCAIAAHPTQASVTQAAGTSTDLVAIISNAGQEIETRGPSRADGMACGKFSCNDDRLIRFWFLVGSPMPQEQRREKKQAEAIEARRKYEEAGIRRVEKKAKIKPPTYGVMSQLVTVFLLGMLRLSFR